MPSHYKSEKKKEPRDKDPYKSMSMEDYLQKYISGGKRKKFDKKLEKREGEIREDFAIQRQFEDPEQKSDRMSRFKSRLAQMNPRSGRTSTILSSAERAGMKKPVSPVNMLNLQKIGMDPLASAEQKALEEKRDELFKRLRKSTKGKAESIDRNNQRKNQSGGML